MLKKILHWRVGMLRTHPSYRLIAGCTAVLAISVLGISLLRHSLASSSTVSVEVESGTHTANALSVSTAGASGGGAVQFGLSKFTVASYNILQGVNHPNSSIAVGNCDVNPVPDDPLCIKTRTARQIRIINGEPGNPPFDIFGTQEISPQQYDLLKAGLPNYGEFPTGTARMNPSEDGAVAIFWNKDKFTKFDSGKTPGISNTSADITVPWVGLKTTRGHIVYVISAHFAIASLGGTDASIKQSAELIRTWAASKAGPSSTVIVVGDMNDKLSQQLSYCVFTRGAFMQHAVDMVAGADPTAGCSANRYAGIDHIYASLKTGITAKGWKQMASTGIVATASDHTPVYVTYTLTK